MNLNRSCTTSGSASASGANNIGGSDHSLYFVAGSVACFVVGAIRTTSTRKGLNYVTCVRKPKQVVGCFDAAWTIAGAHAGGTKRTVMVKEEGVGWSELENAVSPHSKTSKKCTSFFNKLFANSATEHHIDCSLAVSVSA